MLLSILGTKTNVDDEFREHQHAIGQLKQKIAEKLQGQEENVLRSNAMSALKNGFKTRVDNIRPSEGFNGPHNGLFQLQPTAAFRVRRRLPGHFGKIYALHWATNSQDLVSASQDGKLLVWNCYNGNKKIAIPLRSAWVMTCAYSPSGDYVASGGLDNLCSVFNIKDCAGWEVKSPFRELQQHEGYLSCARFVDDNQILTSSGDATCILWDVERQRNTIHFDEHTGDVESVAMCNDRAIFVSGSIDATSKVWDLRVNPKSGAVATFKGHQTDINSVAWFPDGQSFISGSDDSTVRLFDLRAHRQLNCYHDRDIFSTVTSVDFSRSGHYLISGYDEEPFCLVWNTMTGERITELDHPKRASCVQTSPNGGAIATGCWDKILRIWA